MNPSLAEYHVPVHSDVPEIDVIWTDIPDPHAPMGARGIGKIGITGVGAAVMNAVHNATANTSVTCRSRSISCSDAGACASPALDSLHVAFGQTWRL
jgi:hypothetical protein